MCSVFKKGFRHCEVIKIENENGGICIAFAGDGFFVSYQKMDVIKKIVSNKNYTTVFVGKNIKEDSFDKVLYIMTCVSVVKSVIGINKLSILTPFQLYKYLINNGAIIFKT
ncbi:MAG: hypothetical protein ACTSRT_03305 [Promethearchaeota archaeon]